MADIKQCCTNNISLTLETTVCLVCGGMRCFSYVLEPNMVFLYLQFLAICCNHQWIYTSHLFYQFIIKPSLLQLS